jgi:hypothetical protein
MDLTLEGDKFWGRFDERLAERIQRVRERNGRVFVIDRVFLDKDRPESRYSPSERKVQRVQVGEMLSQWPRREAFRCNADTYYELMFADTVDPIGSTQ